MLMNGAKPMHMHINLQQHARAKPEFVNLSRFCATAGGLHANLTAELDEPSMVFFRVLRTVAGSTVVCPTAEEVSWLVSHHLMLFVHNWAILLCSLR